MNRDSEHLQQGRTEWRQPSLLAAASTDPRPQSNATHPTGHTVGGSQWGSGSLAGVPPSSSAAASTDPRFQSNATLPTRHTVGGNQWSSGSVRVPPSSSATASTDPRFQSNATLPTGHTVGGNQWSSGSVRVPPSSSATASTDPRFQSNATLPTQQTVGGDPSPYAYAGPNAPVMSNPPPTAPTGYHLGNNVALQAGQTVGANPSPYAYAGSNAPGLSNPPPIASTGYHLRSNIAPQAGQTMGGDPWGSYNSLNNYGWPPPGSSTHFHERQRPSLLPVASTNPQSDAPRQAGQRMDGGPQDDRSGRILPITREMVSRDPSFYGNAPQGGQPTDRDSQHACDRRELPGPPAIAPPGPLVHSLAIPQPGREVTWDKRTREAATRLIYEGSRDFTRSVTVEYATEVEIQGGNPPVKVSQVALKQTTSDTIDLRESNSASSWVKYHMEFSVLYEALDETDREIATILVIGAGQDTTPWTKDSLIRHYLAGLIVGEIAVRKSQKSGETREVTVRYFNADYLRPGKSVDTKINFRPPGSGRTQNKTTAVWKCPDVLDKIDDEHLIFILDNDNPFRHMVGQALTQLQRETRQKPPVIICYPVEEDDVPGCRDVGAKPLKDFLNRNRYKPIVWNIENKYYIPSKKPGVPPVPAPLLCCRKLNIYVDETD